MSILKRGSIKKVCIVIVMMMCVFFLRSFKVYAQTLYGPEYQVKAGFVYNFIKFVEWPQNPFDTDTNYIVLCIMPDSPETDVFLSLNDKRVGGKKIMVRKVNGPEEIDDCHILFFDSKDRSFIKRGLKNVRGKGVLTIAHIDGFSKEGGIINFFFEEGRLRFEVNMDAAKDSGLKLGSQILMSAEIVSE